MRHAARTGSIAFGIDTFQMVGFENVIEHLKPVRGMPSEPHTTLSQARPGSALDPPRALPLEPDF
ncbi:MAG: hypothetical protein ABSC06_16400 [Rhodopila sp.]|jgi:hypothetical protein